MTTQDFHMKFMEGKMKKILSMLMNSINLMGYGRKINEKQLQNRNEVYYEINQPTPYTGKIVNYYENCQIETKENYKDGKKEGKTIKYYENKL